MGKQSTLPIASWPKGEPARYDIVIDRSLDRHIMRRKIRRMLRRA